MVFSLKSMNLEELMSKGDVNQVPQSVDSQPKLTLAFSLTFLFQGDMCSLFIELLGIYQDMVRFPCEAQAAVPNISKTFLEPRGALSTMHHLQIECKLCQRAKLMIRSCYENLALPSFHSLSPRPSRIRFQ